MIEVRRSACRAQSGSGVATEVYADQVSKKWAGYFNAGGEAKDGHKPEEVEQGIYDNIEKLKQQEVPADELQKVKNNFAAAEYRRLSSEISRMGVNSRTLSSKRPPAPTQGMRLSINRMSVGGGDTAASDRAAKNKTEQS